MPEICGIYKIENSISHKVYIGQSIDIKRRWRAHIRALTNGTHKNIYLQRAWNKDGPDAFKFSLIESCVTKDQLNERETYWATKYLEKSYNLGATGLQNTMSQNTKLKLRKAHLGKKLSWEHKRNISLSCANKKYSKAAKLKMQQTSPCVKAIICIELNQQFFSLSEAARQLHINKAGICYALKHPNNTAGKINNIRLHWRYK